jgi:hypothetical protein
MYALLLRLSGWHSHCSAVVAGCFHSVAFSLDSKPDEPESNQTVGSIQEFRHCNPELSEMLYLAHVKNKARFPDESELVAKSQPAFVRQYLGLKWPEPHLYYAMFNTEMRSLVRPRCSLSLASIRA